MKIVKLVFLFCTIIAFNSAQSQEPSTETPTKNDSLETKNDSSKTHLLYNIGMGLYNYRGDVGYIEKATEALFLLIQFSSSLVPFIPPIKSILLLSLGS